MPFPFVDAPSVAPVRCRGLPHRSARWWLAGALALAAVAPLHAQGVPEANVVHLSAQAEQRVPQDWITVTVAVRHQAPDAAAVQAHLRRVLDQALGLIRPRERAGRLEVASGGFHVQPRYRADGQISGWQGSAELLLQGRDIAGVAGLAAELPGMAVTGLQMSLSREAARQAEAAVRGQAIDAFRQQATEVARAFGFQGYELREVQVGIQSPGPEPRPMLRAMAAAADAAPALPVEPGQTLLQVTVSGTVRLR